MPKFTIQLGRIVRETRTLVVDAPSRMELENRLSEVYHDADIDDGWEDDNEWGCNESDSHAVVCEETPDTPADFVLSPEDDEDVLVDSDKIGRAHV